MGKSIELILLKDHESGPKTAKIGNWPGQALYSQIIDAPTILDREELNRPGLYILKSPPEQTYFAERIYIGQSDFLRKRLKEHIQSKKNDFNEFVAFSSKDSLLHKATIRYLESRIIHQATTARSAEVVNVSKPDPESKFISEADKINSETFLNQMKLLLPLLGFRFLIPSVVPEEPGIDQSPSEIIKTIYKVKSRTMKALMYITEDGFVVTKGSQASAKESKSIGKGWIKLRQTLKNKGLLIDKGESLVFTQDTLLQSASAASSVVLGRQSTGPQSWIEVESGKSYFEILKARVGD